MSVKQRRRDLDAAVATAENGRRASERRLAAAVEAADRLDEQVLLLGGAPGIVDVITQWVEDLPPEFQQRLARRMRAHFESQGL